MEALVPGSEQNDVDRAVHHTSAVVAAEAPAVFVHPRYGTASRALFGFVGAMMLFMAVVLALSGGWADILLAAGAACVAAFMGYFAVTGREPASSLPYTPSRRFAELADPTRPLTPDDMRLPHAPSVSADPSAGPESPESLSCPP